MEDDEKYIQLKVAEDAIVMHGAECPLPELFGKIERDALYEVEGFVSFKGYLEGKPEIAKYCPAWSWPKDLRVELVERLTEDGMSKRELAGLFGVSEPTIARDRRGISSDIGKESVLQATDRLSEPPTATSEMLQALDDVQKRVGALKEALGRAVAFAESLSDGTRIEVDHFRVMQNIDFGVDAELIRDNLTKLGALLTAMPRLNHLRSVKGGDNGTT